MEELILHVTKGEQLAAEQISAAVAQLISEEVPDEAKARFLRAFREKGETAAEIAALARALLAHALNPEVDPRDLPGPIIDICGTGGDRMELFNISTASMFVLAAGGAVVVKHGNRAITSKCGGADVLEELGVRIDLPPADLRRCVTTLGLGFIFAPAYHPAFKAIAPVRKQLAAQGVPTVFNMLGPLLNPAQPPHQLVGVFSKELLPKYAEVLLALGRTRAWAVHGDGTDEVATTGPTLVFEIGSEGIQERTIHPQDLGIRLAEKEQLRGGNRRENAEMLVAILQGRDRGPKSDIVALNAAAGFVVVGLADNLEAGLELARNRIATGTALAKLRALQAFS